jgi:hypothetical protein
MPENLPEAENQRFHLALQHLMQNGVTRTTADLIGKYTAAESAEAREALWAQVEPEVFEAAYQAAEDSGYVEAALNGEYDDDPDFLPQGDNDYLEGEVVADEAQAPLQITQNETRALTVATALAPRRDAETEVALPVGQAKWFDFQEHVGNAHFAKIMAPCIFSGFPCYGELQRQDGQDAMKNMNVALKFTAPPRGELGAQGERLLRDGNYQRMAANAARDPRMATDVDMISAWVRDNGLIIGGNTMNFPRVMGNYEPEILFALSEDETFLFVRETTQGDRSPVDMQYVYSWKGGRKYYADHPEAITELSDFLHTPGGINVNFDAQAAQRILGESARRADQRVAARREREALTEKAPVTRKAATPISDKPVTLPQKKAAATSPEGKPFKPMPELQKQGFARKILANREQAMQQEVEGGVLTILPKNTANLATARDFVLEFREDAATPGEELGELSADDGRDAFFLKLQEMIDDRPTPGSGMGMR